MISTSQKMQAILKGRLAGWKIVHCHFWEHRCKERDHPLPILLFQKQTGQAGAWERKTDLRKSTLVSVMRTGTLNTWQDAVTLAPLHWPFPLPGMFFSRNLHDWTLCGSQAFAPPKRGQADHLLKRQLPHPAPALPAPFNQSNSWFYFFFP